MTILTMTEYNEACEALSRIALDYHHPKHTRKERMDMFIAALVSYHKWTVERARQFAPRWVE